MSNTTYIAHEVRVVFSNTNVVTSGTGTANPSGAPELILGFSGVRVAQYLVFCLVFYR
jgi:hypothetical protein